MSLVIATSVYHLRKTRPIDYYLTPTIDLLNDFSFSEVEICVFTDQYKSVFPDAPNIHIFKIDFESFIKEMWNSPNWKEEYQNALKGRFGVGEQGEVPELLAIWLGKMVMMKTASQFGDHILWQDSGIRMPRLFSKDFSKYQKCQLYPEKYQKFTDELLSKLPLVFMTCDQYIIPYHGVVMRKYSAKKYLIRAGFILARSSEILLLKEKVKEKWKLLVENKDYGTEENALTLYQWERPDSGLVSYDDWLGGLGLT